MNKQEVNRTQPKGCSTSELDAAIAKLEQEMPIIEEGVENVCFKEEKLKLTALKFMRLMMEPSREMIDSWNNYSTIEQVAKQAIKEVQGE